MKLLTAAASNAKTAKNSQEYLSFILHLAPADVSGFNTCKWASEGCKATCLNTAGRGRFSNVQQARIRKTHLFFRQRSEFFALLLKDLSAVLKKSQKTGQKPVVRLNGTSDIPWHRIKIQDGKNVFELFPDIQFYDYTANIQALEDLKEAQSQGKMQNYYLVFSHKENNLENCERALQLGYNVAVVFQDISKVLKTGTAIDGDTHDLRFLDRGNSMVVALKAKGKAKKDCSGFVV